MTDITKVVTVFGSALPLEGTAPYEGAREMGRLLAEAGFVVATGGYGGVMEGTSRGACEAGGHVIGVTCERIEQFRRVKANRWVQEEVRFPMLRDRMYHLITVADALVAMPGGVGTLGEVAAAWNGMQTGELETKPFVLVGPGWRATFDVFLRSMDGMVAARDAGLLLFAPDPSAALAFLKDRLR